MLNKLNHIALILDPNYNEKLKKIITKLECNKIKNNLFWVISHITLHQKYILLIKYKIKHIYSHLIINIYIYKNSKLYGKDVKINYFILILIII